ncbi:MAG: ATP-dependent zinc protease [Gammaproteobacteria bacterium]
MIKRLKPKEIIGWREWVGLPELGISLIKAKVDTGARTSALHAFSVKKLRKRGNDIAEFAIHPKQRSLKETVYCKAKIIDIRLVKDSGGHQEERYVIETPVKIANRTWPIEITLTNRDIMNFRMLLGRTAIRRHYVVDSNKSYLLSSSKV